jgi:hypothetical protein
MSPVWSRRWPSRHRRQGLPVPQWIFGGGATALRRWPLRGIWASRSVTAAVRVSRTGRRTWPRPYYFRHDALARVARRVRAGRRLRGLRRCPPAPPDFSAQIFSRLVPALPSSSTWHITADAPFAAAASKGGRSCSRRVRTAAASGSAQVELMTGRPAPVGEMRQAGLAELEQPGRRARASRCSRTGRGLDRGVAFAPGPDRAEQSSVIGPALERRMGEPSCV